MTQEQGCRIRWERLLSVVYQMRLSIRCVHSAGRSHSVKVVRRVRDEIREHVERLARELGV
jgi:hypothetical protein